jgi:hypothetical protein
VSEKHPHLGAFVLLPPKPGVCPECAVDHAPETPHNAQSMVYQYDFYGKNGRWPTWGDALAHCSPETREIWGRELRKKGIAINELEPSKPEVAA